MAKVTLYDKISQLKYRISPYYVLVNTFPRYTNTKYIFAAFCGKSRNEGIHYSAK